MSPTRVSRTVAAEHVDRATVREQDVVRRGERVRVAPAAGRVLARARSRATTTTHGSFCVIQCGTRSPSRRRRPRRTRRTRRRSRAPASRRVLERLRQVPVVERDERLDPVREQLVDEPVVEVEARVVHGGRAPRAGCAATRSRTGTRSSPSSRISRRPPIAVVRVARDRPGVAVRDRSRASRRSDPRCSRRARPRRRRPRSGTRSRRTPDEVRGKTMRSR